MIKVLVVEDSAAVREFLVHVLNSAPGVRVIGTAADGEEALEFVDREKPDVIAMDINMPKMNGIEATRRIMETHPVPIVIVSGIWNPEEVETTFRAMEAGALAVVQKPRGIGHSDHEASVNELIQKVRLMSEIRLVRRWPKYGQRKTGEEQRNGQRPVPAGQITAASKIKAVAIAASTGGPPVLHRVLSSLPGDFPAPLLIVQHIAPGFIKGMVDWISATCRLSVGIARAAEALLPGHVYFAPDGQNMGVGKDGRVLLGKGEGSGTCPSAAHLFRSVAEVYGAEAVGVLLTGMGSDGARELKLMKDRGAVTIIQDRESAVVYGMPGVAEEIGAASYVLSPGNIVNALITMTNRSVGSRGEV